MEEVCTHTEKSAPQHYVLFASIKEAVTVNGYSKVQGRFPCSLRTGSAQLRRDKDFLTKHLRVQTDRDRRVWSQNC